MSLNAASFPFDPPVDTTARTRRLSSLHRVVLLSAGIFLGLAAVLSAPLPVPLEMPLAGGSAMLILKASPRARRLYVKGSRRWPKTFKVSDRLLRRRKKAEPSDAAEA
ncbi:hypothetical protein [Insolitispirillum peregrinum]|uniref:hypothetical protein n=1 Tax=Insolitispirillum peregrinum TaxID=80876 RepID=UPI00360A4940